MKILLPKALVFHFIQNKQNPPLLSSSISSIIFFGENLIHSLRNKVARVYQLHGQYSTIMLIRRSFVTFIL